MLIIKLLNQLLIRFIDIILGLMGIILLSPIFILIAIVIKIDSKGPIFYKQIRIGKNSKEFFLYKFRSMRNESDKKGLLTVGSKDPRITKSGYFLRKYKLDELPQLINVINNHMSFVGPRPEVKKYVNLYTTEQRKVLTIKPGITDYASIKYSDENSILSKSKNPEYDYINIIIPEKIKLNMIFINNYNIHNYIKIIILTIVKIMRRN